MGCGVGKRPFSRTAAIAEKNLPPYCPQLVPTIELMLQYRLCVAAPVSDVSDKYNLFSLSC